MIKVGNRNYRNIEQWQIDYIKENYQKKYTEIAEELGIDYRRVGEIVKLLGIERERHWKIYLPKTKEVEEKLLNPYLSHIQIAQEYGVSDSCVALRRKELDAKVRKKNSDTLPELAVAKILDSLDIVYFKQKRIDKWSIDFYLGRKHCIDVHGEWAHSKLVVQDRDHRKKLYLEEEGFSYLVIREKELNNSELVKRKIEKFTLGFPRL